jgi:peptidoglycan glycosyltransferase
MLLLDTQTGEILAMASHPTYDPNRLDDEFEALTTAADAPLLNRAAQGQYQPGSLLQPFIMAAALEQGLIRLDETVADANRPVPVNDETLQCATPPPEPATWVDVLTHRCPAPVQALAAQLGITGLHELFVLFALTAVPNLPLNTETPPQQPLADPLLAGVGQENLVLSPLQLAIAWSALAGDGRPVAPRLVTAVQAENEEWLPILALPNNNAQATSAATAQAMRLALTAAGRVEFSDLVLSGPEGNTNGWYVGVAPAANPRYLVVVVLEGSTVVQEAEQIGRALLDTAVK